MKKSKKIDEDYSKNKTMTKSKNIAAPKPENSELIKLFTILGGLVAFFGFIWILFKGEFPAILGIIISFMLLLKLEIFHIELDALHVLEKIPWNYTTYLVFIVLQIIIVAVSEGSIMAGIGVILQLIAEFLWILDETK